MVIGKDKKQSKGAWEWHETICSGQLGRGCWEGPGLWSWPSSGLNSGATVYQFSDFR